MTVKVVTDSVADLPPQVVKELGITVIPILIRFGTDIYRDGVDLTADKFYYKLAEEDTATPDEAEALVERLSSKFPKERIYRSKMTPAIGAHTGPHLLLVAVQEDRG